MSRKKLEKVMDDVIIRSEDISKRPPCYVSWKPVFSCPLSPHIAWHWGFEYKECPLVEDERDMNECASCHLKAKNTSDLILRRQRQEKKRKKRPKEKKDQKKRDGRKPPSIKKNVVVEKGKTYISP